MVNHWVVVASLSTKHAQWSHVLHVQVAAATVVAIAQAVAATAAVTVQAVTVVAVAAVTKPCKSLDSALC
jgi:2-methylcitrate dehydratase PrpD